MKQAIIIVQDLEDKERQHYYGPFENGTVACYWAGVRFKGYDWHWEEMTIIEQPIAD